jgi:hypothetical protein
MASQVSPGIVLKERDLSNAVVIGAQQIVAAFAGSFAKGPVSEIVQVNSQKELVDNFGKPTDTNAGDWYVASEFLAYGGRLAVVRAASGVLNATSGSVGVLVANDLAWDSGTGSSETFVARTAGTWGNSLQVVLVDRGADQIVTFDAPHATPPSQGDTITFSSGKVGVVYSVSGNDIAVVLDAPSSLIAVGDTVVGVGAGAADVTVTAVKDWYLNTEIGSTGIKLSAIAGRPGTSAYAADRGVSYDEVHVAVIDTTGNISGAANTILARYTYLSKIQDAKDTEGANNFYKEVLNNESAWVFNGATAVASVQPASGGGGETVGAATTALSSGDKFLLFGLSSTTLSHGSDDYAYTATEISDAYDLFLDTENTTVDFVLMGGSMSTENDTKTKAAKVIGIAASRKDCVAFVSPYIGNQVGTSGALSSSDQRDRTIDFFNGLTSTSYAVFDSGYKFFYDRFNDKYRYIACNGDVAGLCVTTSATLDDWYSPAGLNRGSLRNAIRLAYNPNKADRDALYQSRINPIVSFPGAGVTLFGDKTALASPSAFDRINVRRLFLNIEKRVEGLAKQVLFDLNDEVTRGSFASAVNAYLNEVQARRGVTDYLVVCDSTNNTPEVIDRNEFVAELFIKPTRSINYITVTFTATKSGVNFSEVVGG